MDSFTPIRLVISIVGLTLLGALTGIVVLALGTHPIPDVLQNVAVGALTALVSLLVPTRSSIDQKG
jgi:hypothetical protein